MIETIITLGAMVAILAASCFLMWAENYEDGIVGHAGLACMAMAAFVVLYSAWHGTQYEFQPSSMVLFVGIAIFMLRHTYRFIRFSCGGKFAWKRKEPAGRRARSRRAA